MELLVVIAIVGILIALLLPAIQSARESARLVQCKNNLKQIALATLQYEAAHKSFPTGGWSSAWLGDPNVRPGARQPGGWIYQSLPYLEQQAIADIGRGLTGPDLYFAITEQGQQPVSLLHCPSRRSAKLYPTLDKFEWNYFSLDSAAKTDYAANAGTRMRVSAGSGPQRRVPVIFSDCKAVYPQCRWMNDQDWLNRYWDGIVGDHSGAKLAQITDGASHTVLVGEKWLYEVYYEKVSIDASYDNQTNGTARDNPGDNGPMLSGFDYDNVRTCSSSATPKRDIEFNLRNPQRDKIGDHYKERFGGAHQVGLNLARCDGSVDTWNWDVDSLVWGGLGARDDGRLPN